MDNHLAKIHPIRSGDIVTKALNRVYVHEAMSHPVHVHDMATKILGHYLLMNVGTLIYSHSVTMSEGKSGMKRSVISSPLHFLSLHAVINKFKLVQ